MAVGSSLDCGADGLGVGARLSAGVVAGARGCRALLLHRPPRPCRSSLSWVAATAVLAGDWFPASMHTNYASVRSYDSGLLESKPCRGLAAAWVLPSLRFYFLVLKKWQ